MLHKRWKLVEDWTMGNFPDYHGGYGHVTNTYWFRFNAKRIARKINFYARNVYVTVERNVP